MRNLLWLSSFLLVGACAGDNTITDVTEEGAGANCPAGGLRVATGADGNDNGVLDSGEVDVTRYICTPAPSLTEVSAEAAGANCTRGGLKIESGKDNDGNGTLEGAEVTGTNYICGNGEAQVVKAFNGAAAGFPANTDAEITILSANVTTTTGGELLAIGSADVFCTAAECPDGNPDASGRMYITDGMNMVAPMPEFDSFFLQQLVTESVTRTARFPIAAAGTHTFNLRGQDVVNGFTFYRPGLTLVFLP